MTEMTFPPRPPEADTAPAALAPPPVSPAPSRPSPLQRFDELLDLERSVAFHEGRLALGLSRFRSLLAALPALPAPALAVHVAGSEGKTGTTLRLAAGLRAAGLRVGAYTSPHLRDARERLTVDLAWPPHDALEDAVSTVLDAAARAASPPSWFEALTATARVLFARQGCDAVVWETGLGGRLDATSLLPADCCAITSVSLEHTAVLGDSLAAIAREKAGILRPGRPLVLGRGLAAEARDVLLGEAARLGCPVDEVTDPSPPPSVALAQAVLGRLHADGALPAAALAPALAAAAAHVVEGRDDVRDAVLFDAAHTAASCAALAARLPPRSVAALVFASTAGRDPLALLLPLLDRVSDLLVLTRAPGPRGLDPRAVADALAGRAAAAGLAVQVCESPEEALGTARARVGTGRRILVTGSLYLLGRLLPPRSPPSC